MSLSVGTGARNNGLRGLMQIFAEICPGKGTEFKFAIFTQLSTTLLCKLRRKQVIFDFPV